MAIIVKGTERIEVPDTDLRIQAYRALYKAAERIGIGNYKNGLYRAQCGICIHRLRLMWRG